MDHISSFDAKKGILKFNGTEVKFNPALFNYLYLEEKFEPTVNETTKKIYNSFDRVFGNMNDFIVNIDTFLSIIYAPLNNEAVRQLSLLGCYSYDAETFFKRYVEPKFERIIAIKEALFEENERIEKIQAVRDSMRTLRRHAAVARDRDRGFKDDGLLTNIGHGVFNTIAKAGDEASNLREREKEFMKVKNIIKDELCWIAIDMPGSVAELLHQEVGGEDYRDPRTEDDFQKAENIFNNLKKNNVPELQKDKAAIEVFALNPQLDGFLPWCVKRYGDPDGDFEQAAKVFRVDILKTKQEILNSVVNIETEENAIASKVALEIKEKELSFSAPELTQKVNKAITEFDLKYRTIDGVEFKTRNEADNARRQLKEMQEILSAGDLKTEKGINAILKAIDDKGLDALFVEKKKKELQDELIRMDQEYRTVDGIEFMTREEADLAKSEFKKVKVLSEKYHLDNPDMCLSFLSAIGSLNLKTSIADRIIKDVKDKFFKQKETLEQIVKKYGISIEKAVHVLSKHSVLMRNNGIPGLAIFNLLETNTYEQAKAFGVSEDDVILGHINLYNSKKDGILITQNGFYSRYRAFWRKSLGFSILALSPACFSFWLLLNTVRSDEVSFVTFSLILFVVTIVLGLLAVIFQKMIFKILKWDKKNQAVFTKINDAFFSLSSDKTTLYLSRENFIPTKNNYVILKEFDKITKMVKELQKT